MNDTLGTFSYCVGLLVQGVETHSTFFDLYVFLSNSKENLLYLFSFTFYYIERSESGSVYLHHGITGCFDRLKTLILPALQLVSHAKSQDKFDTKQPSFILMFHFKH